MGRERIGLIGHRRDAQLERLAAALQQQGAEPVPFDLTDIPAHVAFHWQDDTLRFGALDLGSLQAVHARTAHFPMPTFVPGATAAEGERQTFSVRESGSLMNAVVSELARRMPVVNPPGCHRFHGQKPFMYRTLQAAGVPVPEFAVGCDLAAAAHFVQRFAEQTVVKPLMGGEVFSADFAWLKEHHAEVDRRPLLLQRRIVGQSLRAYVVNGAVVAAAEMVHGAAVDWRSDLQAIRPLQLDAATAGICASAAAALGLLFAAVDLELEGGVPGAPACAGTPWVIDVNPAPMYAGFELRSGLDVAGPLAAYLIALARGGDAPAGDEA